ncbi:unnamed protein product [Staurois parvus]|uniref:Uncharacterized protein n=1 Tax=Staurois parvus TaxID=386267 RepID=A0ABN9HV10_9NEOB|nr:unnamed protein product [Staurois parvus]
MVRVTSQGSGQVASRRSTEGQQMNRNRYAGQVIYRAQDKHTHQGRVCGYGHPFKYPRP